MSEWTDDDVHIVIYLAVVSCDAPSPPHVPPSPKHTQTHNQCGISWFILQPFPFVCDIADMDCVSML